MEQTLLYAWFGAMLFLQVTVPLARNYRGLRSPEFSEYVAPGFALGGVIALFRIFLRLISQSDLRDALELDGQSENQDTMF
ncbi:MAG: hypothetical protein AAF572_27285 [Cyanobacteria bacterium P01_B01_bin.77]